MDIRKQLCMGMVVKKENRFLGEMVNGPSLSVTKMHLDSFPHKCALTTGQP